MTLRVAVSGAAEIAAREHVPSLVSERFASRLFQKDFTLWGKAAEEESAIRLGWVDAAKNSLELLGDVSQLAKEYWARGIDDVVLCGMGGSSLAPEVIAATFGKRITVLDATDPSQVLAALDRDLSKTVVVVSSKSGSTVETDSQKRVFEAAFEKAEIDKRERIVIVTDPGSPMEKQALSDGYRVFNADPTVGGRYSALTAFGLVPCVLAGVDMKEVLLDAISASETLASDEKDNPSLVLGAALARSASVTGFKDKVGIVAAGSPIVGFGDWLEQLIAESTGKESTGVLPVVLSAKDFEVSAGIPDILLVGLIDQEESVGFDVTTSGSIGEQMLLWEVATVVASRLLGINPFDQPDVESAKVASRSFLESPSSDIQDQPSDNGVGISSFNLGSDLSPKLEDSLQALLETIGSNDYLAIHCYLSRSHWKKAEKLRNLLAQKINRPVTFGWGPRFLHSTGQYHKGGPRQGVFLQLTSGVAVDLEVPGRNFTLKQLIDSQSSGDASVLASKGRPVLTLRLDDVESGLARISGLIS